MTVEATHEHVVKHAQIGDERARLWDQGSVLAITMVYRIEERRLTGARASDDRHPLSALDRECDVVQDGCAVIARTDFIERDGDSHLRITLSRAWSRRRLPRWVRPHPSTPECICCARSNAVFQGRRGSRSPASPCP